MLVGNFNGKIGNDENRITNGDTSITSITSIILLQNKFNGKNSKLRHFEQTCQM